MRKRLALIAAGALIITGCSQLPRSDLSRGHPASRRRSSNSNDFSPGHQIRHE